MCCDPIGGSAADRLWIFGGMKGTIPVVDQDPTSETWFLSKDETTWTAGKPLMYARHSHTSFYIPKLSDFGTAYRKFRHVGGNGT